jgi:hypothetical protein
MATEVPPIPFFLSFWMMMMIRMQSKAGNNAMMNKRAGRNDRQQMNKTKQQGKSSRHCAGALLLRDCPTARAVEWKSRQNEGADMSLIS